MCKNFSKKTNSSYIKRVSSPLCVDLYTREALQAIFENNQITNYTAHFDASGLFVGPLECAEKRMFVYELVVQLPEWSLRAIVEKIFIDFSLNFVIFANTILLAYFGACMH